ncbi:hypothetical protein KGM_205045 [Danaus plexippus plexippus]|uniref:HAP1 N-terminal domain-containing protein n=1 Tax=Danaus plexippus plexippus TaxID=278856 RepID=A0A212ENV4_DANPL|nr:hypothetical protein KGM_205045 [Danaus plexippus plexippus]
MSGGRSRPRPRRRDVLQDRQQDLLFSWNNELCNSEEVPEVEIISLLQEHIPKYRLRADSLTQFGGYENQDWFIPSPALPVSQEDLALTPDQIRETLNYFQEYSFILYKFRLLLAWLLIECSGFGSARRRDDRSPAPRNPQQPGLLLEYLILTVRA